MTPEKVPPRFVGHRIELRKPKGAEFRRQFVEAYPRWSQGAVFLLKIADGDSFTPDPHPSPDRGWRNQVRLGHRLDGEGFFRSENHLLPHILRKAKGRKEPVESLGILGGKSVRRDGRKGQHLAIVAEVAGADGEGFVPRGFAGDLHDGL